MQIDLGGAPRGPLAGVRVLDFSAVVSGPLCAQILGDLGADVVKVEPPEGDTTRRLGPPFKAGLTPLFAQCNRNKRSLVLDLKAPEGVALARRLAARADVLVENFRPGVAERLGIGWPDLAAANPRLVYVSISGFGPDGPYAGQPAYDMVIQALSGLAHAQREGDQPRLIRNLMADKSSALSAAYAALAALFARERSGRGQKVELPMLDAYAAFALVDVLGAHTFPPVEAEPPDLGPALYRAWQTADGHVAVLVLEDHQFHALCRALDREDLIDDPRCASTGVRIQHAFELFAILESEIRKWPTTELVARARKFEAPLAPVNDLRAFLADPQVSANGTVVELTDPEAGTLRLLGHPARYGETPSSLRRRPPRLGEHSDEVLGELGLCEAEIATLRETGAVR
jgi:crotonobetainyl-CoA:carnitine CoA-transferase CaiB-like acyl-CoA transferase